MLVALILVGAFALLCLVVSLFFASASGDIVEAMRAGLALFLGGVAVAGIVAGAAWLILEVA